MKTEKFLIEHGYPPDYDVELPEEFENTTYGVSVKELKNLLEAYHVQYIEQTDGYNIRKDYTQETCKWDIGEIGKFVPGNRLTKTECGIHGFMNEDFKYCPFCGKLIERI